MHDPTLSLINEKIRDRIRAITEYIMNGAEDWADYRHNLGKVAGLWAAAQDIAELDDQLRRAVEEE